MNLTEQINKQIYLDNPTKLLMEFNIESIKSFVKNLNPNEQIKLNKKILLLFKKYNISKDFVNYTLKHNNNDGIFSKINLIKVIIEYVNGNDNMINKFNALYGKLYIDYIQYKLKGGFFKNSLTGDKLIDEEIKHIINVILNNNKVIQNILNNITDNIKSTVINISKDKEFKELLTEDTLGDVISNNINKTKENINKLKFKFSKKRKYKFEIIKEINKAIPDLNKNLKKIIQNAILKQNSIITIHKKIMSDNVVTKSKFIANVIYEPIINYIVEILETKYSNDNNLEHIINTIDNVIYHKEFEKLFQNNLAYYIRNNLTQ